MCSQLLAALSVFLTVAMAAPTAPSYGYSPAPSYRPAPSYNAIPQYDFDYAIKDYNGNDFGHQESRDGYDTKGSYYVQLPDGRRQHVRYYVSGDSGFVAEVTYEGVAQYPATYGPTPTYGPAPVQAYSPVPAYG
ncbi:cuticle protein 7-like isoform X1 [Eriocheir sinensis]|uniref:cuticle protein 7-like isoform X1 n=2 Tax=Eriocheir sinensis TaxID=95602 RepID=UPI0021C86B25|nr:cuticle protein 7-like isoform X1 [Eriocheir sinensis]